MKANLQILKTHLELVDNADWRLQLVGGPSLTARDTHYSCFLRAPIYTPRAHAHSNICVSSLHYWFLPAKAHLRPAVICACSVDSQWTLRWLFYAYLNKVHKKKRSALWRRKLYNTSKNWIQTFSAFLRGVNSNNSMKSSSNLLMNYFLFKLSMSNSFE